jgi:hypothetical protein
MTHRQALRTARAEASTIHRTAASRGSVTWGFTVPGGGPRPGFRRIASIGTYREAQAARREWIGERIAQLREEARP